MIANDLLMSITGKHFMHVSQVFLHIQMLVYENLALLPCSI